MENNTWDPMKDDYNSEANTYDSGPGAKLPRQYLTGNPKPLPGRTSKVRLHVKNLPNDFTKEAMDQIFSQHGRVTESFIHPMGHFGGVTFEDQSSALRALTELTNDPTYNFQISFFVERDKAASDNMPKRNQQYHSVSTREEFDRGTSVNANGYSKSRSVVGTSPNNSSYPRYQSKPFADMNSAPTPLKPTSPQSLDLAPLPPCANCGVRTIEQCMKCLRYFCTKKCMLLGFQFHRDACITIAPHTSEKEVEPLRDNEHSESRKGDEMETFQHNAQDYRRSKGSTLDQQFDNLAISNAYDNSEPVKQNPRRSDDFVSKKSPHNASEDYCDGKSAVGAGPRSASGYQNRSTQQRSYDGARRRSQNDEASGENQGPKTNSRMRGGENDNDRPYGTQNARRSDSYRNDGGRSNESRSSFNRGESSRDEPRNDEYRQDRSSFRHNESRSSYNESRSRYNESRSSLNKSDSARGEFLNDENRQKRSSLTDGRDRYGSSKKTQDDERFESQAKGDEEGMISFSDTSRSAEKKRSVGGSRGQSDRRSSDDNRNNKQSDREPESTPAYLTKRRPYEEGETVEVRLTELNSDPPEYSSIITVEEGALLPKMLADMAQETDLPSVTIGPNTKCLVCRGRERVRAVIVKTDPLQVKYIDTGYVLKDCDEGSIRGCPEKFGAIKPFAYKVKFVNAEKADLERYMKKNETFKVTILKKQKELVWEVEIKIPDFNERLKEARQTRDTRKDTEKENQPVLVSEFMLMPNVPVEVIITHIEDNEQIFYVARSKDLRKLQDELAKHAKACPKLESVEKFITCMTFDEDDEMWYRARIIETNPLKVFFIDYGNTDAAKESALREVPMVCNSIPPLAVKVKIAKGKTSDYDISVYDTHVIRPKARNTGENLWVVVADDCSEVTVVHIVSDSEYFVISDDDLDRVTNKVGQLPIVPLTSDPKVGSTYLIMYEDMSCRAKLTSLSPPTVQFVDFGNDEKINKNELGVLPAEWEKEEPMAFKISVVPGTVKLPLKLYNKINIRETENPNEWKVVKIREDS